MGNTDLAGVQLPDGAVWLFWSDHKCGKDGDSGVPALSRNRGGLCGYLQSHDYVRGNNTLVDTPPAGPLPQV